MSQQKNGPPPMAGRVRAERARLGISQYQAAAALGISRETYRQLEDRTADPHLSRVVALVNVLGMDLAALAPELAPKRKAR